jgi:hypothetical protein
MYPGTLVARVVILTGLTGLYVPAAIILRSALCYRRLRVSADVWLYLTDRARKPAR